jgi:nucleotide-binding universal stress UspA family protein
VQFRNILCGVEGSESSTEAARQAIALAREGGKLHFLGVYTTFELLPDHAKEALQEGLERAVAMARDAGVEATSELAEGRYAVEVLMPAAGKHDLLVVGTHEHSRAAGLVLGSTASDAAHQTEHPLLIARAGTSSNGFPAKILLASDGTPGSWAPVRAAASLAAAFEADLEILYVGDGSDTEATDEVEAQTEEIESLNGTKPKVTQRPGHPTNEIVEVAKAGGASLVVCGRRGLKGVKSLGSVSERVVHQAPCSVLVVPPEGRDGDGAA